MRLIDADELKNVFEEHEDRRGDLDCDWRTLINNAPTVERPTYTDVIEANKEGFNNARRLYERPKGKWVEVERHGRTGDGRVFTYTITVCSKCGEQYHREDENFCPNCGAEMEVNDEQDDIHH